MVETVKKIGLSLSVIVLFALYAMQKQARPLAGVGTIAASAPSASPAVVAAAPDLAFWSAAPHDVPIGTAIATATPPTAASTADLAMAPSDAAVATARNETPTSTPTPSFAGFAATTAPAGRYRDGTYDGGVADANWGEVAVQAIIAGGQLSDVRFLQYPNHRGRSVAINEQAMPILTQEAIQSQQAAVDIVTGATDTSEAFIQSLDSALRQAAT